MSITFGIESIDQWYDDIQPLLNRHWSEIAVYKDIPLDPNWEFYRRADSSGILVTYTARDGVELVGYSLYFILPTHHHYKGSAWATSDINWIVPEYRRQGIARGLFDLAESDLRKRGVVVVHTNAKTDHPDLGKLLQSRDYRLVEHGYQKRL